VSLEPSLYTFKALTNLSHANVISLIDAIHEGDHCYLIFESMDSNLHTFMKDKSFPFHSLHASLIMKQVLNGLAYIHSRGFIHRDVKPENILIRKRPDQGIVIKLGDFGLSRMQREDSPLTQYTSTRWYRAPECLLKSSKYSFPVDIWAVGVIWVELLTFAPLFAGNSEIDQVYRIAEVLGPMTGWEKGQSLASLLGFRLPRGIKPHPIVSEKIMGSELIKKCILWNPDDRVTASSAVAYFCNQNPKQARESGGDDDLEAFIDAIETLPTNAAPSRLYIPDDFQENPNPSRLNNSAPRYGCLQFMK